MSFAHSTHHEKKEPVTFISWENEKVECFAENLSTMIELVKYLPDISQDVNLRDLEIDTKTIQNVVQFANIMAELPVRVLGC